MKIAVKDLRPNPFRDLGRYPINQEKVAALVQSIKDTDFWDNLVARKGDDGTYQLAYGVHRLQALKKSDITEIDIPVRKLNDTIMVKMMAHENQVEWGVNAIVDQETVRAIVLALGDGKIEMPKVSSNNARFAPSFTSGSTSGRPEVAYSSDTIAKFLGGAKAGWADNKVEVILATLAAMEGGLVEQEDFVDLTTHQAAMVAKQARRVVKETGSETLAKTIGKRLAGGMRSSTGRPPGVGGKKKSERQSITYHGAARAADQMMASQRRHNAPKQYPPAGKAIPDLAIKLQDVLSSESSFVQKVESVIAVKNELHTKDVGMLVSALRGIAKRATRLAERLGG